MEKTLQIILNELNDMRTDLNDHLLETKSELKKVHTEMQEMRNDFTDVKAGQNRIESNLEKLNTNIITSLGNYTNKIINHFDDTSQALNKRIFKVETEVEKANRQ